jgi:hypothetical protein
MLTQKTQNWPKSCGAANTLVARIELGDPINLTNANEDTIYNQLVIHPGALGAGEILPHSIANHMQANGRNVAIIESPHTTAILLPTIPALDGMYALYNANIGALYK